MAGATQEKKPSAAEAKKAREDSLTDEQVQEQREELAAGKKAPSGPKLSTVAESRSKRKGEKPLFGTVDNMTARDGDDPLEGHFVVIDYSKKATRDAVQAQLGDHVEPGIGSADYGVYLEPGVVGTDGYPETAIVFLRDEHAARITVPYDCLKRSTAGGRR